MTIVNIVMPFGYSSIIDFQVDPCKEKWLDTKYVEEFVRAAIDAIGMEIHEIDCCGIGKRSALYIDIWAGADHPDTYGVSCIVFLTTSSFSLHTTQEGKIMIDCFSCKKYDLNTIRQVIGMYWGNVQYLNTYKMDR
jgi:S-adenosylmethionine/arginine decarboxylase-like enzyme